MRTFAGVVLTRRPRAAAAANIALIRHFCARLRGNAHALYAYAHDEQRGRATPYANRTLALCCAQRTLLLARWSSRVGQDVWRRFRAAFDAP